MGGQEEALPPRCAACDGYNPHAGVAFEACDRSGLERFDPTDFVAKLAAVVAPPRVNQTLYKVVLAANVARRPEVAGAGVGALA